MDRTNGLRAALESDRPALGAKVSTFSPAVIEVYGGIGLDYAWLDLEHAGPTPFDSQTIAEFSRAGEVAGIDPLVRLPSGDPHLVRKVLDAGIRSVLIPRVETAEEVREAVRAARFTYDGEAGERGVGIGRTSRYGTDFEDHVAREDREALVGVMIENETAVANLEEILAVPELGFVFVGPADLSVSQGRPLETDHPAVRDRVEDIRDAALDAGVPAGRIAESSETATRAATAGFSMLRVGGDISAAAAVLGERVSAIREEE
jgi:2-keto-3-deoxy-L-rhamnonate aldolase RhmA